MPIFVIAQYNGYEGHSAPVQAFEHEVDARAAIAILSGSETWRLYAVPIWPELSKSWFSIEPLVPQTSEASGSPNPPEQE